jgi:hypothetical protein
MGFPQAKQSTTKYHFPGVVKFGIASPRLPWSDETILDGESQRGALS